MSLHPTISALACLLLLPCTGFADYSLDFETFAPGALPPALEVTRSNEAAPTWSIQEVEGDRVLAQEGLRGWETVIIPGTAFGDLRLSGKIKATGARRVQGFIWRYQDPDNFFVIRSGGDAEGGEIPEVRVDLFYKGKRVPLGGNTRVENFDVGQWHTLTVEHEGPRIRLFLDGRQVHEIVDAYWCQLLPEKGALGFYTFRSQALFDDLQAEELPPSGRE